jgi:hypothetical protein
VADARKLADQLVPELAARGAVAVALTGSHARGDATSASDLDLIIVGDGPDYRLDVRDGILIAESWASAEAHRARLYSVDEVGSSVPGWREAVILHDSQGVAGCLKHEALKWGWEQLGNRADRWVAEQLVGLVEEIQKLVAALRQHRALTAAVQRDILALRLAPILAVHHRLLYGTENRVWEQVGQRMGAEWRRAQAAAFSTRGVSLEASCAAALRLFHLASHCVSPLLDERQAAVLRNALSTAALYENTE